MSDSVRGTVRELLQKAVEGAQGGGLLPAAPAQIPIDRAKRPEHGEYATNVALGLAKAAGKPPHVLGEAIVKQARLAGGVDLAEATVAGPGFGNLSFSGGFWQSRLLDIRRADKSWGRGEARPHRLCVDARNQVAMLALSVWVRYMEIALSLVGFSAPIEMKRAEEAEEA